MLDRLCKLHYKKIYLVVNW